MVSSILLSSLPLKTYIELLLYMHIELFALPSFKFGRLCHFLSIREKTWHSLDTFLFESIPPIKYNLLS